MGDSPSFQDGSLWWLAWLALGVPAVVVLLTGWTGWRVYRHPTLRRLVEHGVLLQLWLWVWVIGGPYYHAQWGYWPPALFLANLLLLAGRMGVAQRARKPRG
jgi:hypothetical protein